MGYINTGNQVIIKRFESDNLKQFPFNAITPGIYSGGNLVIGANQTVSLRPIKVLIQAPDSDLYGITTTIAVNLLVTPSTPYIILSYIITPTSAMDYMDIKTSSTFTDKDIVVGKAIFSGTIITDIDYSERIYGDIEGTGSSNTNDLISDDASNAVIQGTDGKLFVPTATAGGVQSVTIPIGESLITVAGSGINPTIGSSMTLQNAVQKINDFTFPDTLDGGVF